MALCVLTRRSLAEDGSPENVAKQARRAIDRYELELANHLEIEEQVVFPECRPLPIVADLLVEHRALEAQIAELRIAPSAELLERFCGLLSKHIRREENELFEQVQAGLPRAILDRMGSEIDRRVVRVCL